MYPRAQLQNRGGGLESRSSTHAAASAQSGRRVQNGSISLSLSKAQALRFWVLSLEYTLEEVPWAAGSVVSASSRPESRLQSRQVKPLLLAARSPLPWTAASLPPGVFTEGMEAICHNLHHTPDGNSHLEQCREEKGLH